MSYGDPESVGRHATLGCPVRGGRAGRFSSGRSSWASISSIPPMSTPIGASEEITGRALREFARRDDVVIATKVSGAMRPGPNGRGLSRKAILHEIDASLKRLGTDYVDLYQIHRWDYDTPDRGDDGGAARRRRGGKARYIGASSMHAWQFAKALAPGRDARLDALRLDAEPLQPALSRGGARDDAALPRPGHRGDPVESAGSRPPGARAGRERRRSDRETDQLRQHALLVDGEADQRGGRARWTRWRRHARSRTRRSPSPGCCRRTGCTAPIVGATKMAHLEDAVAALSLRLTDDEIAQLEEPYVAHEVVGFS